MEAFTCSYSPCFGRWTGGCRPAAEPPQLQSPPVVAVNLFWGTRYAWFRSWNRMALGFASSEVVALLRMPKVCRLKGAAAVVAVDLAAFDVSRKGFPSDTYWSDHSWSHSLALYSRAVSRAYLQCHIIGCQRIDTALLPWTLHPSKGSLLGEISPSAFGHALVNRCDKSRKRSGLSRAARTPSSYWAIMLEH